MNPCGHETRHTGRIGCCSGCGRMFTSDSAFAKHRRNLTCHPPESVGLVGRESRTAPGEVLWGLPSNGHSWEAS